MAAAGLTAENAEVSPMVPTVFLMAFRKEDVDVRVKRGHDGQGVTHHTGMCPVICLMTQA
jgi:hypothetical protein